MKSLSKLGREDLVMLLSPSVQEELFRDGILFRHISTVQVFESENDIECDVECLTDYQFSKSLNNNRYAH